MLVIPVGTVTVSALLWLPMPKLVQRLGRVLDGELQSSVVSLATIIHKANRSHGMSEFMEHSFKCACYNLILSVVAIFCDYYNVPDGCEWHYKPCGANCMKTCRNPSGNCSSLITAVEGTKERFLAWLSQALSVTQVND